MSDIRFEEMLINNLKEELKEVKQQLAEKEKTIDNLNKQFLKDIENVKKWWVYQYEGNVERENQDKISFCIEQLEKAKSFCISAEDNGWCVTHKDWLDIVEYIDNQIKQLKEGK